jgi:hypothetical protein
MFLYRCANCQYEMQSEESLGAVPAACPKCLERTLVAVPIVQRPAPEPVTQPDDPLAGLVAAGRAAQAKVQAKVHDMTRPAGPPRPPVGRPMPGRPPVRYAGAARGNAPGAMASIICGILAVLTFATVLGGIALGAVALFTGLSARNEISRNPGRYTGEGMATAGIIMGLVGAGLAVLALVGGILDQIRHVLHI